MATKILSDQQFVGGARITGHPVSTANGQPVVHEQLAALQGALIYQGAWNASTNSPAIPAAATANKGHYYVVSVSGSTNINGITDWQVSDWIVSNGTAWEKVDNSEAGAVPASDTVAGVVELATVAEINTGTATNLAITPAGLAGSNFAAKRFSANVGDGTSTSIAVTHNLNTQDVAVTLREVSTNAGVIADWVATSVNVVTLGFAAAPASNAYRVTIQA